MRIYNPTNIKKEDMFVTNELVSKPSVFLAGPCPRGNEGDWRDEFFSKLGDRCKDINFFNPTNSEYSSMGPNAYNIQCEWERAALSNCNLILFWVARDDKHPALTTNVEFGYWLQRRPYAILYGRPENAQNIKYLDWLYTTHIGEIFGKNPSEVDDIFTSLDAVIDELDNWSKCNYTEHCERV